VDLGLQENKATNLAIAAPKVNGILIRPGETFSFWKLVGNISEKRGYKEGLIIRGGNPNAGIGGGMCQFTNLLHWMALHTDLVITEHHHHNAVDLFPDFNRVIPFGTGTSILYNYLDYRVRNLGNNTYQIIVYTTDEHLCGEIRANESLDIGVHIHETEAGFHAIGDDVYRRNKIYRRVVDKRTGNTLRDDLLLENNAKVMYERSHIHSEIQKTKGDE